MQRFQILIAAQKTMQLARDQGLSDTRSTDTALEYNHLHTMLDKMTVDTSMDLGKMNRWLGWMQAAVMSGSCGRVSLRDFMTINKEASETPPGDDTAEFLKEFDH